MEGWIKLHRKVLDNGILTDQTAWTIFSWLLLKVDRKTGKKIIGRFWASEELRLKPSTFYKALKRLEKKWQMVTLSSNNQFTEVSLTNWSRYQSGNSDGNNQVTTKEQPSNTLQEVKNIRIKNNTKVLQKVEYGNPDINELIKYFLIKMSLPKEDCTQRQSRQYWNLLLKESRTGVKGVKWLIDLASTDEFYKSNITSSKDLYYKRIKLISRKRGDKPKFAVMGVSKNE